MYSAKKRTTNPSDVLRNSMAIMVVLGGLRVVIPRGAPRLRRVFLKHVHPRPPLPESPGFSAASTPALTSGAMVIHVNSARRTRRSRFPLHPLTDDLGRSFVQPSCSVATRRLIWSRKMLSCSASPVGVCALCSYTALVLRLGKDAEDVRTGAGLAHARQRKFRIIMSSGARPTIVCRQNRTDEEENRGLLSLISLGVAVGIPPAEESSAVARCILIVVVYS